MNKESETDSGSLMDEQKLREYMNSSAEEKLEWLEQINRLNEEALTPEKRKIRERLKKFP